MSYSFLLSTELLQLQVSECRKRKERKTHAQPDPNISSDTTNHFCNRANIPSLRHADNGTCPSDEESRQGRRASWKVVFVFPRRPIEAPVPAKNQVLLQYYRDKDYNPISHECEEILEDDDKLVPTSNGADKVDEDDGTDPQIAWHHFAVAAHDLAVECSCISARCVVGDDTQSDDYTAEFAEASHGAVTFEYQGSGRDIIGSGPRRCHGGSGG